MGFAGRGTIENVHLSAIPVGWGQQSSDFENYLFCRGGGFFPGGGSTWYLK